KATRIRFNEQHDRRYGHAAPDQSIEIVNLRLAVTVPRMEDAIARWLSQPWMPFEAAPEQRRPVVFDDPERPLEAHPVAAGPCGGERDCRPPPGRRGGIGHAPPAARTRYRESERGYFCDAGAPRKHMKIKSTTREVVRNAVNAYADEMARALCKSAYNMMIYEVRDFCCGLIDGEGRMISQNKGGLPIFLADLGIAVKDGIERYGLDGFAPGDVIIM